MTIEEGQREVRQMFLGGFPGQLSSAFFWAASAAAGVWGTKRLAILMLVLGGAFIFPVAQLILRLMGRPATLSPGNPFNQLAMQVAFLVPLLLPLVGAAALHRMNWFYPALMIVVGAHYLPFCFLYGMRSFAVLGGLMLVAGLLIGVYLPSSFTLGAWVSVALLLAFAVYGLQVTGRERAA